MPVVRVLSVIFIEFWRGVPLITVLFMSSVMLPLFMAEGTTIDKLIRAWSGSFSFSPPMWLKWFVAGFRRCLKDSTKPQNPRAGLLENAGAGDPPPGAQAGYSRAGQHDHRPF